MQNIKYQRNFLSNVICRVDFNSDLQSDSLNNLLINQSITNVFPIKDKDIVEKQTNYTLTQTQDMPQLMQENVSFIRKVFVSQCGKNKCNISPKFLILEYNDYSSFEKLKNDFLGIIQAIQNICGNIELSRFGLRYINVFNVDNIKIYKTFFSEKINEFVSLDSQDNGDNTIEISRALGKIEYVQNDIRLNMVFGEFNRNYPGVIQKHDFVLDYDAFIQGLYKLSDIFPQKFEAAHDLIQQIFEQSITDRLRNILDRA